MASGLQESSKASEESGHNFKKLVNFNLIQFKNKEGISQSTKDLIVSNNNRKVPEQANVIQRGPMDVSFDRESREFQERTKKTL